MNLADIQKTVHPEDSESTFSSKDHETFSRLKVEIIFILTAHIGIKLKMNANGKKQKLYKCM
jgi:hypothetical protein